MNCAQQSFGSPEHCGSWSARQSSCCEQLNASSPQLGRTIFDQVCAKCHRLSGERLVGPTLGGNPTLTDPKALALLVHEGRLTMPPVGSGWDDRLVKALAAYAKTLNAAGGGGTGG